MNAEQPAAKTSRNAVIRGHAVGLDAVESAIRARRGVRAATVEVEHHGAAEAIVVAYVVMEDACGLSARALRSALLDALPPHGIPMRIVALQNMPVTKAGTVDRAALTTAYGELFDFTHEYVAPRTEEEKALERIWCAVLGMDRVGIDDDFFELGGQSLHAVQIASMAADDLGVDVSVDVLFDRRTIRALAEAV